jgi:Flp pilus assembly protein TadB
MIGRTFAVLVGAAVVVVAWILYGPLAAVPIAVVYVIVAVRADRHSRRSNQADRRG